MNPFSCNKSNNGVPGTVIVVIAPILAGLWLTGCLAGTTGSNLRSATATTSVTSPGADPIQFSDEEIISLAADFRDLRAVPGHFNGREWNDAVDQWNGRKHTLMIELGLRLGSGDYDRPALIQLLGRPDHILAGGDPLSELIGSLPGYEMAFASATEYLVYEWRGTNDFLFFASHNGQITASDWWYAGE